MGLKHLASTNRDPQKVWVSLFWSFPKIIEEYADMWAFITEHLGMEPFFPETP